MWSTRSLLARCPCHRKVLNRQLSPGRELIGAACLRTWYAHRPGKRRGSPKARKKKKAAAEPVPPKVARTRAEQFADLEKEILEITGDRCAVRRTTGGQSDAAFPTSEKGLTTLTIRLPLTISSPPSPPLDIMSFTSST